MAFGRTDAPDGALPLKRQGVWKGGKEARVCACCHIEGTGASGPFVRPQPAGNLAFIRTPPDAPGRALESDDGSRY